MKKLYDWHDVAKRTEIVYDRALKCSNQSLLERLSRYDIKSLRFILCSRVPLKQVKQVPLNKFVVHSINHQLL